MTGIVFGCYIPLHIGHISLIEKALKENDNVIIGVCGFDEDRGKEFIPFKTRYKLMKTKYSKYSNTIVVPIDDKKIGLTGTFSLEAWKIWCNELFTNAKVDPYSNDFNWYMGEKSYADKIKQIYPKHNFIVLDRNTINISGTIIRKSYKKYKKYIDSDFLTYLKDNNI